jgi:hypothetical protein
VERERKITLYQVGTYLTPIHNREKNSFFWEKKRKEEKERRKRGCRVCGETPPGGSLAMIGMKLP